MAVDFANTRTIGPAEQSETKLSVPAVDPSGRPLAVWLGLAAAAHLCPSTRGGKPVHPSTLTRWILKGVRLQDGTLLKLAAKRFPGGWATTREALDTFINALTDDRCGEPVVAPAPRSPSARARAIAQADRELERLGI
jgi:hypothetical protein